MRAATHAGVAADPNGVLPQARNSHRRLRENPPRPRSDRNRDERRSRLCPDNERTVLLTVVPIVLALVLLSGVVLIASGLNADSFGMP